MGELVMLIVLLKYMYDTNCRVSDLFGDSVS